MASFCMLWGMDYRNWGKFDFIYTITKIISNKGIKYLKILKISSKI